MPRETQGVIDRVPCPHCDRVLDFSDFADEAMGGAGWGAGLEPGSTVVCDHCNRKARVERVRSVTIVLLVAQ